MLPVAVDRSSSDNNEIRYVLPVFVDDVMFAHNRLGKGDANRAYTQIDLPTAESGA